MAGLALGVNNPPQSKKIDLARHPSLKGETRYNSDNQTPFQIVRVYNGTGGALTANRPYLLTFAGTSTSAENPRVTALAAQAGVQNHVVIAHEAIADASWGWVCYQGYHDCGIEGTTDVAAGDYLLVSAGVSTTGLVKDGTSRTQQSCAIACEAQATNSVVDKRVYLFGGPCLTSLTQSFAGASFSDQLLAANGTLSLPSYTFTSDPDTGMYRAGANSLGLVAGGNLVAQVEATRLLFQDAVNLQFNTTTGTKIGTATSQKIGFYGVTPVVQPAAYVQTFATADRTHAARTGTTLTMADGAGTNDNTIGAITADASVIAAFQEVVDEVNKIIADLADTASLVNSLVDDHQALGFAS